MYTTINLLGYYIVCNNRIYVNICNRQIDEKRQEQRTWTEP